MPAHIKGFAKGSDGSDGSDGIEEIDGIDEIDITDVDIDDHAFEALLVGRKARCC